LLTILFTSVLLAAKNSLYAIIFGLQVAFYSMAAVSWIFEKAGVKVAWLGYPQYFVITNLASVLAFIKLVRGERYVRWQPLREPQEPSAPITDSGVLSGNRGVRS